MYTVNSISRNKIIVYILVWGKVGSISMDINLHFLCYISMDIR